MTPISFKYHHTSFRRTILKNGILTAICLALWSDTIAQVKELRIDPAESGSVSVSQVMDEVTYIPLESTSESLFGTIQQLLVTDTYFVIRDSDTNTILVFYRNGKFHCKIRCGPGVSNILLNKQGNEIVVAQNSGYWFYDLDGKKLREEPRRFYGFPGFFPSGERAFSFYVAGKAEPDVIRYEITMTRDGKKVAEYMPYNAKKSNTWSGDLFLGNGHGSFYSTGSDTSYFYTRPYDPAIYTLSTKGLSKKYTFVFPAAYSLPVDFSTDTSYAGKKKDYVTSNPEMIYKISHPRKIGDHLFFKLDQYKVGNDSYMYDLNTDNFISMRYLKPDAMTFQLPVTDVNDGNDFTNNNFLASDASFIYSSLPANLMFKYRNAPENAQVRYEGTLQRFFSKGSRKDNPVIVQIKPKVSF